MVKIIGLITSIVGVIMTFVNAMKYTNTSQKIQAWYYYRSELEIYRTYLIIGLIITVIGVVILLASYIKNKNKL